MTAIAPDLFTLHDGDALDAYGTWPTPELIMVDGPYGVGGFFGDPRTPHSLHEFYRPHIEHWTKAASFSTTLWFWCTEIGWATVHPVLNELGWDYVEAIHWDKGIAHVAGNVNGKTIRRFPIANEICVFYTRRLEFPTETGVVPAKAWLRSEWVRSGLPVSHANRACGVKDAAVRKYLDQGWLWYFPPGEMMDKLAVYANEHGKAEGRPYFSLDGQRPITGAEWERMRYRWNHTHGLTNVWQHAPLHGKERVKNKAGERHAPRVHNPTAGVASAHLNQKPLELMRRVLNAATIEGDIIWEPFGGLCSASVAALELGRSPFAAEINPHFAELARERLVAYQAEMRGEQPGQTTLDL